ncbi:rod shape-determining protein MreB [Natranaerovirga pectinivora]|uniref:Cell shape-determining protein MreB n=1 Tax=Natranaerovirga pectinivora TaxID=682400 RepID=A0A4V2V0A5_9FIRM|nr:rod shape-determining protein [Natranaerovirga pectinivora]TCT14971.1 rod shape-determining protein MreB [Natranaerovirga pectinivora]
MIVVKVIGIDLGTKSIKIYKKHKGVALKEFNLIAKETKTKKIVAAGNDAYEMLERTPRTINVSYPVKNGVIADFDNMLKLLNWYLKKLKCKKSLFSKNVAYISVPWDISEVEKRAIYDLVNHSEASIKKTFVIDKPIAAALGASIDVSSAQGNMIVDLGGDTTEISVVSLGGIVISKLLNIGGSRFDEAIGNYIKKKYSILIGNRTAEQIKINLASAYKEEEGTINVYGRDLVTGLPKEISVSSLDVYDAIVEYLFNIIDSIKFVLEKTPPELSADIIETGIYLTGGGAMIDRLGELILKETGLKVNVVDEPDNSVIRGIGKIVEKSHSYKSLTSIPKAKKYKYS